MRKLPIIIAFLIPTFSFCQAENESSIILIYKGAEYLGYCMEHFETEEGDELTFIDSDFGSYADPYGMCGMQEEYLNKKFRINYTMGVKNIYIEDVGKDEIETKVITSVLLVK